MIHFQGTLVRFCLVAVHLWTVVSGFWDRTVPLEVRFLCASFLLDRRVHDSGVVVETVPGQFRFRFRVLPVLG